MEFSEIYKLYWINSEGYNLNFRVFLQHSDDSKTFISLLRYFDSIPDCINDSVSSAKY